MRSRLGLAVGLSLVLSVIAGPGSVAAQSPDHSAGLRRLDAALLQKLRRVDRLGPGHAASKERISVIVQLDGAAVADFDARALERDGSRLTQAVRQDLARQVARGQDQMRPRIAAVGANVQASYRNVLNGFRVSIRPGQLGQLAALPGVRNVYSIPRFTIGMVDTGNYVESPRTWSATGFTGKGVTVAIIDTGIDYFHADFGGSGNPNDYDNANPRKTGGRFPTAKVVAGHDFVGNAYDAGVPGRDVPKPDPNPLDCNGHGTHVAGIAAGTGVVRTASGARTYTGAYTKKAFAQRDWLIGPGVAPQAKLVALKVFGCEGATDVVIDAIDMAVELHVDVINMSLGSVFADADDVIAVAVNAATNAGVVVVGSAGNSGPSAYIHGGVTTGNKGIAVAAVDAHRQVPRASVVRTDGTKRTGYNMSGSKELPLTARARVLMSAGVMSLGCDESDWAIFPAGRIAVVSRGVCAFVTKGELAEAAGAIGIVVVNNAPGGPPPYLGPQPEFGIPMIGLAQGTASFMTAANNTIITIKAASSIANADFGYLAYFTSGGPRNGDSALKPDIAAPGVDVISAGVGLGTRGVSFSGSSMASPVVAGVAALVVQAHPRWAPLDVKAALMGTALTGSGKFAAGQYDVRLAGAGVVNALRATRSVAFARTVSGGGASLSFGYSQLSGAYSAVRSFRLVNRSGRAITYKLSVAFNGSARGAALKVSPSTVTVAAHSSRQIDARLSISAAAAARLPNAFVGEALADNGPTAPLVIYQPLITIKGAIVASPVSVAASGGGSTGVYPLRVPFLIVPRATSSVGIVDRQPYVKSGAKATFNATVTNTGGHRGSADFYAWGLSDKREGLGAIDIRAAGVQGFRCDDADLGCEPNDRLMVFAVNSWGRWSNLSTEEFDILIDVNDDHAADFAVFNVDAGLALAGELDGTQLVITCSLGADGFCDGDFFDGFFPGGQAPNGSTTLLPTVAGWMGLDSSAGHFAYGAESYNVIPSELEVSDMVTNASGDLLWAPWNPWLPAVNQGAFVKLAPAASRSRPFTAFYDRIASEGRPKGWMLVTLDDANGARQAELISLGKLP